MCPYAGITAARSVLQISNMCTPENNSHNQTTILVILYREVLSSYWSRVWSWWRNSLRLMFWMPSLNVKQWNSCWSCTHSIADGHVIKSKGRYMIILSLHGSREILLRRVNTKSMTRVKILLLRSWRLSCRGDILIIMLYHK